MATCEEARREGKLVTENAVLREALRRIAQLQTEPGATPDQAADQAAAIALNALGDAEPCSETWREQ